MLPFNSVFHIKLLLSLLFLKKTNALGAAPPSASATLTVCHCEKALLPFVLVKLEESCHKSKTLPGLWNCGARRMCRLETSRDLASQHSDLMISYVAPNVAQLQPNVMEVCFPVVHTCTDIH